MNRLFLVYVATLLLAMPFFSGCHTVTPASRSGQYDLSKLKQAHIVVASSKDRGFLGEIERVLVSRGVMVTRGTREAIPPGTQFYVYYTDVWTWDMVMYPDKVKISFHDPINHAEIGSAQFKNSFFHTFPDPPEIAAELIGRIYGETPGTHMK